tara:strand:- start:10877 stop:11113 length:237 start_codon:yes stop_codon:yes gene_type:complete
MKIINNPAMNMTIEIPRNCNSPIGDAPRDSMNILNRGPFIGRKSNTRKMPIICLSIMNSRVGTHFSNHSAYRIDLEIP